MAKWHRLCATVREKGDVGLICQHNHKRALGEDQLQMRQSLGFRRVLDCFIVGFLCSTLWACGGGLGGEDQSPDTVVDAVPLAYVKRTIPLHDPDDPTSFVNEDLRDPYAFRPGAALWVRETASPSAAERNITETLFAANEDGAAPLYDVRDLSVAEVGSELKLLFSARAPEIEGADDNEQPTWNIYIYDVATATVSPMLNSTVLSEAGHDIQPLMLPTGDILFVSSRQHDGKARLIDEGKSQYNALAEDRGEAGAALHLLDTNGQITQLTFNPSHDLFPQLLSDGRILFVRWDNFGNRDGFNLYRINADGTDLSLVFGWHSHDADLHPGNGARQYGPMKLMADNRALISAQSDAATQLSTRWQLIDWANYVEHDRTVENTVAAEGAAFADALLGSLNETSVSDTPALAGRLHSLSPLLDGSGRFLVSWSPCRVFDPEVVPQLAEATAAQRAALRTIPCTTENIAAEGAQEADPLFSLWVADPGESNLLPVELVSAGEMVSEALALTRASNVNLVSGSLNADLQRQQLGVLDIRSIYDVDGADTATGGISILADPAQTTASERSARYIRLIKSVPMPPDFVLDIPGTAFGRSAQQLMREIIGYAPIEPDGSVRVLVPADVAFSIEVLDANGRRISDRHQNWLQVKAGETLLCQGCHTDDSEVAHGRSDAQPAAAYQGALAQAPFSNTQSSLIAQVGETMAQTRARILGDVNPSLGLVFDDIWTDTTIRAADASVDISESDLSTTTPSTNTCQDGWDELCRILINYETHIHPIWAVNRPVLDAMSVEIGNNTCTLCHNPVDAMSQAQVPAGQLDLTDGPSADEPDHFQAYRELLFNDNEQALEGGTLVDRQVPVLDGQGNQLFQTNGDGDLILDGDGQPIPLLQNVTVAPSMVVSGANNSQFFTVFSENNGTVDHRGLLNEAELKLLSEWVDIGAQYYNDPFAVPQD